MAPFTTSRRRFITALGATSLSLASPRIVPQSSTHTADGCIDVHHHILPPEYVRLVGRAAIGRPAPNGLVPDWNAATSLKVMDDNGVQGAVVSVSSPGVWLGDIRLTTRLARACNEFAAQMAADHPGRFGFFAVLPLPDVKAALAELAHAVDVLQCDGIGLMTNYDDRYLGDAAFQPLFDEIQRRRLTVYVHPHVCSCDVNVLPQLPAAMLEFPHSTTRTIMSLVSNGTFLRCPDIRFIFSHAGGTIPYLVERIRTIGETMGKLGWVDQLQKLYFDTASSGYPAAFASLMKLVTAKQVLLGTDFPWAPAAGVTGAIAGLQKLGLSVQEVLDIQGGNARRLFPRFSASKT